MSIRLNKSLAHIPFWILFALESNALGLQWPVSSQDDPNRFNLISGTFGEIHPPTDTTGDHFHTAIDIDTINDVVPARAAEAGVVCEKLAGSDTVPVYHGIDDCNNIALATKKTRYIHIVPEADLSNGDSVLAGETLGVITNHLHFEMWYKEGSVWYRVNPLQNDISDWVLGSPADNHDPEINNVILQPIAQPSGIVSGYEIKQTAGAITDFLENSVNVHFWDRPGSEGIIYGEGEEKLVVYGSVAPIVNARDTGVNTADFNSIGTGLTIQTVRYNIDDEADKYKINFDRVGNSNIAQVDQVFHATFNSGDDRLYGNNDFLELRSLDDAYLYPHKKVNNIQSNGVWATMATQTTADLFQVTPTATAKVNSEAKYKDGIHSLAFEVSDAVGNWDYDEMDVVVDNFRPFLERAEIKNSTGETKYLHVWNFDGTTLTKNGPVPNEALGDGTYTINFRFSEPVVSPTLLIDTLGNLQLTSNDPAGNQKNFSANFSVGNNSPIQDGLRTMTVTAKDLAENFLLLLPTAKTTINPNSELTRSSAGTMQGTAGPASVDFIRNFLFSLVA